MAAHPWAQTPLGDPRSWPDSLRIVVGVCLASQFPMMVAWGPDLIEVYNDGYRPILGRDKHPSALGAPTREIWSEIWDDIGPRFASVFDTGKATWSVDQPLVVERDGYPQQAFFTSSYSPILASDGTVDGVLVVVVETTQQVLDRRRLSTVRHLASELVTAKDVTAVGTRTVGVLAGCDDLPTAELHLRVDDALVPMATNSRSFLLPAEVARLDDISHTDEVTVLDPGWTPGTTAQRVALRVGDDDVSGVLVAGLNPTVAFDEPYEEFVRLVGRTIGASLANTYRRAEELGEQRHISDTLQQAMLQPANDLPTVAARYVPASGNLSVGGDWYDVVDLGGGRRGLVVGDCVGHGLAAATAMGALRNVSRAMLAEGRGPADVLTTLDRFARTVDGAACATALCAVVDLAAHRLTYATAGHPPALLVRDGVGAWLEGARGLPLAVVDRPRDQVSTAIEPGDLLALYTDGLVERRTEDLDDGLGRLLESIEAHHDDPVQAIADEVLADLLDGPNRDDVVLVVKRVH